MSPDRVSLYPHQEEGARWLAARPRAYLGDMPGLGKSRTLIRALELAGAQRPLVVCPAIVRTHWRREFEAMGWETRDLRILSYEQVVRGGEVLRQTILPEHDALILDEAHLVRTAGAQRTRLLLGRRGYARHLPVVWAASGTPMWKHPGNLWTVMSSLFPEVVIAHGLRTYTDWLNHFCAYAITEYGPRVFDTRNTDELQTILDRVMLRRTLDDVGLALPPMLWEQWTLDAKQTPELRELDRALEGEWLDENESRCATYRRLVGEAKAPAIATALEEELEGGSEPIVVLAYHRNVLRVLREALTPFGLCYIDGSTPQTVRAREMDAFQGGRARVFLGQIDACQAGITLTAARRVVIVEPSWTNNVNVQAAARVQRIGQRADHCVVQVVALANSLDEAIVRRNVQEARMSQEVFSAGAETHAGETAGGSVPAMRGG